LPWHSWISFCGEEGKFDLIFGRIEIKFRFHGRTTAGNFLLQQTASLSPPVQWTSVAGTSSLADGFFTLTTPTTNGSTFHRLTLQQKKVTGNIPRLSVK
jgi:hypothetical protein